MHNKNKLALQWSFPSVRPDVIIKDLHLQPDGWANFFCRWPYRELSESNPTKKFFIFHFFFKFITVNFLGKSIKFKFIFLSEVPRRWWTETYLWYSYKYFWSEFKRRYDSDTYVELSRASFQLRDGAPCFRRPKVDIC